jgi:hypothetical protein
VDAGGPADAARALVREPLLDLEDGFAADGLEYPDVGVKIDLLGKQPKAVCDLPFDCNLAPLRSRLTSAGGHKQQSDTEPADNAKSPI